MSACPHSRIDNRMDSEHTRDMNTNRNALAATVTATNGTVTLTVSNGDSYSVADGVTFVARLDRKLRAAGYVRGAYTATDGTLATFVRFVA